MTHNQRRILFWSFTLSFFVVAPILVFYTAGYRYKKNEEKIIKTGTFVLSTIPKNANITINGQIASKKTPATLSAMRAGDYTIQLSKDGYWSWEKKLTLQTEGATFASDILLFKNNLPEQILTGDFVKLSNQPEGNKIILIENKNNNKIFWLLTLPLSTNIKPKKLFEQPIKSNDSNDLSWNDYEQVLIRSNDFIALVNTKSLTPTFTTLTFIPSGIINFKWLNQKLFGYDNKSIYEVDYSSKKIKSLIQVGATETITDFWLSNNTINTIIHNQSGINIWKTSDIFGKIINQKTLPSKLLYTYVDSSDSTTIFKDDQNRLSIWVKDGQWREITTIDGASNAILNKNQDDILYSTPFELWTYNPKTDERELLARNQFAIDKISWYTDDTHALYVSGDNLVIIERDGRDKRNRWQLIESKNITGYYLLNKNFIYSIATIGSSTGLYEKEL